MDLYPYLNFFKEYLPPNVDTFYPELNDLDLLINVSSEEEKDIITRSLNGKINEAKKDTGNTVIPRMIEIITGKSGIELEQYRFTQVIKKMSFKTST